MACVYCYVPRRKGYANPITVFTNIEQILAHLRRHVAEQGAKPEPNQCDPAAWVYDLGENSDCSVDALVSDNVTDLIAHVPRPADGQGVVRDQVRQPRPARRRPAGPHPHPVLADAARRRPAARRPHHARSPSGSPPIDDFVAAGYEVHLNFSPVVLRAGWIDDWTELLRRLDDELSAAAKAQAACEVIFLTHNAGAARGQPRLAPARRGRAVAAGPAGGQDVAERPAQRPIRPGDQGTRRPHADRADRPAHAVAAGPICVLIGADRR